MNNPYLNDFISIFNIPRKLAESCETIRNDSINVNSLCELPRP